MLSPPFNSVVLPGGMKRLKTEYCEGAGLGEQWAVAWRVGEDGPRQRHLPSAAGERAIFQKLLSEGCSGPKTLCFPQSSI